MIREPVEEEDDGANGEDRTESGVRPSLPVRVLTFLNLQSLKSFLHPFRWKLIVKQLHGEVEGGVDEEVGHDEGEDVGGRVGKHNVAVWL